MNHYTRIVSVGGHHPETVMTNQDFEKFIDTSDEWIRTRTGIETRRICDPKKNETTMTMALEASRKALKKSGIAPEDLDLIIVGTVTPDTVMPCVANQLQGILGCRRAFTFDLQAACSGFVYAMSIADQYIRAGLVRNALIVGAETLSTVMDWSDRSTCVLFGDGAGAAVLTRTDDEKHRILGSKIYSDGSYGELLSIPHGYTKVPPYSADYKDKMRKIKMAGGEVFKLAVRSMVECSKELLQEHKVTTADVDFFIFHQANMRIIDMCMKVLGVDPKKTWLNVAKYGNTSAATLPICLDEAWQAGAVKPGDLVLMATFGGGLTWGSTLFRL